MVSYSWATAKSGDWNTGTLWSGGIPPNAIDANATIDVANATTAYTVTITPTESINLASLTLNAQGDGTNSNPYTGARLEMDGTLTFTGSGTIGGSLQSTLLSNGGTFVNVGNLAPLTLGSGTVLFKGSNPFYVQNELQSQGTVTVDTASIGELIQNTLTDGIYSAVGDTSVINLGGSLGGLKPDITKIQGPPDQTAQFGFQGWTALKMNGPAAFIYEWNGSSYVSIETTLNDVGGGGLLEALSSRGYTTANAVTLESRSLMWVQGGTTSINGGLVLNTGTNSAIGGVFEGFGTITNGVTNNGTMVALGGTLDIVGALTGTGVVQFDKNYENFIQFGPTQGSSVTSPTGATLQVGTVSAGQTIVMNGDDTLTLTSPASFAGTITATVGDTINLQGVTATSAAVTGNTLNVYNGTQLVDSLALLGSYSADHFAASGSTLTLVAGAGGPTTATPTVPPTATPTAPTAFAVTDTTTGQAITSGGTPYVGPVAGLQWEYITTTADSLNIAATAPNVFIHTGSGNDAIDVSQVGGNNVLDGSTGSNFLVGGAGADTFFVDDRGTPSAIWSTVANFHSGDAATIFGVTPNDFGLSWVAGQGATGYTGLTLHATAPGVPTASLTLAGFTSADLTNGRLTISYGTEAASGGLAGSTYMYVHAN